MPNVISVYVLNDQQLRFGGGGGGVFCFLFVVVFFFFFFPQKLSLIMCFFILFDRAHIQCISGLTLLLKLTFSHPLGTCTTAKQIE